MTFICLKKELHGKITLKKSDHIKSHSQTQWGGVVIMNYLPNRSSHATACLCVCLLSTSSFHPSYLFSLCDMQPEEYGQEAMEGQSEGMLEPEGETYDDTQQVISLQPHTHTCLSRSGVLCTGLLACFLRVLWNSNTCSFTARGEFTNCHGHIHQLQHAHFCIYAVCSLIFHRLPCRSGVPNRFWPKIYFSNS